MIHRAMISVAVLGALALANPAADTFFDNSLRTLAEELRSRGHDRVPITPFAIKVKGNGLTNRDLKANFTQGTLEGLSSFLRQGNCSYGTFGTGYKMGCYIPLTYLRVLSNVEVKGDQISGKIHAISTSSNVKDVFALVEIQGNRGYPPVVDKVMLMTDHITTQVVQGSLDLNSSRARDFETQANAQLLNQIKFILGGFYAQSLQQVLLRYKMP